MAAIQLSPSGTNQKGDTNGTAFVGLYDPDGNPIFKTRNGVYQSTDRFMPLAGINDDTYRPLRTDRLGSLATAEFTPWSQLAFEAAALPSNYTAPATTMTVTYALASGALLNAAAGVAINTNASLVGMAPIPKTMRAPVLSRRRWRLASKGGANAAADVHALSNTATPASAVLPYGFSLVYAVDGTLKPTYYYNSAVVAQGVDIASLIQTNTYYISDIILDDDHAKFVVQDATTGQIINEQELTIQVGDVRIGQATHWYPLSRVYVGASAGTGAATQIYVSDEHNSILDLNSSRPWDHYCAANLNHALLSPVASLTQLPNYANSAAPASATLSNTAAGYTTLGGQFQFAAVAGAETDYALFGFQVPAPYSLVVKGVSIDTMNTGAAVATTETSLQWGISANAPAVTLASGTLRTPIGNQVFPIAAAIGAQATPLREKFTSPVVVLPGRFFHIILKMPRGTATASQVIRGTAFVDGHFE